jgi:putative DNA primase/helicase
MEPFSPDIIITNKIPFDYNKKAYSKACDDALDKLCCHDKSVRMLLEECVGYWFYRRNELRKAIILTGDRENGKSTFLAMLEKLLGRENIAGLDLKELSDRFKTAQLFGKLANIGDDIGDEFIPNPAIFKKLSSGNTVNAEFKGKDPFDFASYAKLIFSANDIPRIKDKSGAVLSRLVIVPFNARFSPDDPDYDPYIKYKLTTQDSMEYLARIGIQGLKRILANCKFTESSRVKDAIKEYEINNNPVLLFFQEEPRVTDEVTSKVYRDYCGFCAANNYQPMSNVEFSKQVKKHFGVKVVTRRVGGKSRRIFVEDDHGS